MIMAKKEFKIGEEFQCGHVKLRVEKSTICQGCFFNNPMCNCAGNSYFIDSCISHQREDKTDVIFVEVEE